MTIHRQVIAIATFALAFSSPARADGDCTGDLTIARPFFYTLTRDGKVSHLLGTTPNGVSLDALPAAVHTAVDHATDLTLETRHRKTLLDRVDKWATVAGALRWNGPKLSTLLTRRQMDALVKKLEQFELPANSVDKISIAAAAMMANPFMHDVERRQAEGELTRELEEKFSKKAVHALYAPFYCVREFRKLDDIAYLRSQLDPSKNDEVAEFFRAYRTGDEAVLAAQLERDRKSAPDVIAAIITKENWRWAPKIAERHRSPGQHLFAITAYHLFGEDGLIEVLRRRGFTVERL